MKAKKGETVEARQRRRLRLLSVALVASEHARKRSKAELEFMNGQAVKMAARLKDTEDRALAACNDVDARDKRIAELEKAVATAEKQCLTDKYFRESAEKEAKQEKEKRLEWRAYAAQLAMQLHAIESLVASESLASMPESVAVRLLVQAAKKKPCPADPELFVGNLWGLMAVGGAVLYAMMGGFGVATKAALGGTGK